MAKNYTRFKVQGWDGTKKTFPDWMGVGNGKEWVSEYLAQWQNDDDILSTVKVGESPSAIFYNAAILGPDHEHTDAQCLITMEKVQV